MNFDPRQHRLLFNIDCNVWTYKYRRQSAFRPSSEPLTAAHIHRYVDVIADGGVDTLVVNGHSTQLAYYPSKSVPTILDRYRRKDRSFFYGHIMGWEMTEAQIDEYLTESTHYLDAYVDLAEAGVDWLAETASACRRRGVKPWLSIRMNDMHGATREPNASYMNCDLYRDPAMRLRGTTYNSTAALQNGWKGFNYEKREVRDYVMAAIRDMVENYDYDGLLLEWNRSPFCCEPDPSQSTIDTITDWHADVRRLTDGRGAKMGRPYALGIKHVGTLDQMRSIGLDLRAMAARGILDLVIPSNFWQSSWDIPCDAVRQELGNNVAVYGAIEIAPNWLHGYLPHVTGGNTRLGTPLAVDYRSTPASAPILRGNAAAKLVLGVDGIEVYNFPCADTPGHWPWEDDDNACAADYVALRRLSELEFLRGQPKFYTLSSQTGYYVHETFESVGAFPAVLGPGERRACRIPMCAEPAGSKLEFVIQVVVEKKEKFPPIGVYFNGAWPKFDGAMDDRLVFPVASMTHHTPDHVGLNFSFPVDRIRDGWNDVVVMNGAPKIWTSEQKQNETVTVASLELAVRKPT